MPALAGSRFLLFGFRAISKLLFPRKQKPQQKPKIRHSRREFGFFEIRLFWINSPALIFCFSDNAITLKFRHSHAGGNPDLSARKLIGKKRFL
ncbi:hypothetical protein DIP14_01725 [Neisseria gonorrhoeae]|nr:hypothetical protein A9Y61_04715 [Neisseria gonorrhoeae]AZG22661.1 hypothetical protein EGH14_04400 [Neisseria gonorrhoeae]AZG29711.1 hypothetical protein EGH20_05175 [Neisseria gonorrhoeae]OHZ52194.1 hypothetical protein BBZ72_10515 [Neisseria gonorrhoeae]OHZ52338.1 hypothetical protein BBZ83_10655 [Neisseria gonorrhoeae]